MEYKAGSLHLVSNGWTAGKAPFAVIKDNTMLPESYLAVNGNTIILRLCPSIALIKAMYWQNSRCFTGAFTALFYKASFL